MKKMEEIKQELLINEKTKKPSLYKVILLNDDYTTMEFVVKILIDIFHHEMDDALNIMYSIHKNGRGVCGIYTFEIAETKASHVKMMAKELQFPLRVIIEKE